MALRDRANTMANEAEMIGIAVGGLMGEKKYDEALKYLNDYLAAHPNSNQRWRAYAMVGEAYAAKGDQAKARESFDKAMAAAHDAAEREEVMDSINSAGAGVM